MDQNAPMTVIRAGVRPERSAGPSGTTADDLTFSRFPPASSTTNPNTQEIDQTVPCASVDQGQECNLWGTGGTDQEISQFNMVFESSSYVRAYQLLKTQLTVPYGYLDYKSNILGCDPNVNYFLCTQLLEIASEIGILCWLPVNPPGSCFIAVILRAMAFFCVVDTNTVGLNDLSDEIFAFNNDSYFGVGPYSPGLEQGLLDDGVNPTLVAELTAFYLSFSARVEAGEKIIAGEFVNFNSVFNGIYYPILNELCIGMDPICSTLPDPADPNDKLLCGICTETIRRGLNCGPWCTVCKTFYGLPDAYCYQWNPEIDNTVCGASDARVFFGDWIPLMNPAQYVSQAGGEVGTAPPDEKSRSSKYDDGTGQCRGPQNNYLSKLIPGPDQTFNTNRDYTTGACTACTIPIIGDHEGGSDLIPKNPDTIGQLCPAGNDCLPDQGNCPDTTNKDPFCYFFNDTAADSIGVGSSAQITGVTPAQRQWCVQAQAAGKGILPDCTAVQSQPLCQNPSYPKSHGKFYGMWEEWAMAYDCSIHPSSPYTTNLLQTCGQLVCETDVNSAISRDVREFATLVAQSCPMDQSGLAQYDEWTGVGSPGLAVKPSPGGQQFNVARCSAGCSSNPATPPQRFKLDEITFSTQTLKEFSQSVLLPDIQLTSLQQRASVWLGGPQCSVYEIVPTAYGEMQVQITLVFPDGKRERMVLNTAGGAGNYQTSINVSDPDYVPFTGRINRVNIPDNAIGPDIVGLIVICGTTGADVFQNTPDGAACDLPAGFEGQIRGRIVSPDDTTATRFTNPWPKIVKQAINTRKAASGDKLLPGEEKQCPTPIPYYLGELNCGLPAYWYYVPFEQAICYGPNCGQFGFQQIMDVDGASLLCQQGDGNTCTPGFGQPLFGGITNGPCERSPCLELGGLVNATGASRTLPGGCAKNSPGPRNMPPGFTWRVDNTDTYDQGSDSGQTEYMVVPQMWVDGSTLFVLERFFQSVAQADVSVYIQADLDAEVITVTPGQLQANATYCGAALNNAPTGSIDGIVLNQSPFNPGTYTVEATCSSTVSDTVIEILGTPIILNINPGQTAPFSFDITAVGPIVLGDTKCEVTLNAGVGGTISGPGIPEAGFLDKIVVSCDLFLPTLIQYAYKDFLLEPPPGFDRCESWDLICILQNAPWYVRYMTYIVLGIIAIAVIIVIGTLLFGAAARAHMLRMKGNLWTSYSDSARGRGSYR